MAVKIQVRRGSRAGLPALAPGEYGLTTDTKELFIGGPNGNLQVPVLGSDGKIQTGQLPDMDYDPAGSAAAVQTNLTSHINNKSNPHGVTAAQVGALPTSGGTMTGSIKMGANDITGTATNYGLFFDSMGQVIIKAGDSNSVEVTDMGVNFNSDVGFMFNGSAAPSHSQSASTISAGTFGGTVKAASSSQSNLISLLRNTRIMNTETTPTTNGEIFWVYE